MFLLCMLSHSVMSNSATQWTVACETPLSMGFFRQEYWSELPCPPLGDLPDSGIEPMSLMSPALQADFFFFFFFCHQHQPGKPCSFFKEFQIGQKPVRQVKMKLTNTNKTKKIQVVVQVRKRSCKKKDQKKYGIFRYRFLGVGGIFLCIGNEKLIKSRNYRDSQ